jgi:hypothetical protein
MVHLLDNAALGGSVLLLVVMILSGIGLLWEEAMKCYYSPAFRWKMALLAAAVAFYFTLHRRAALRAGAGTSSVPQRIIAVVSLLLWLGVGIAGRAIGLI